MLNGESRNTWITPENYREVAVVFGPQFVQRHGLDVAKLEGLFMAPLTCQQNALFTRWLSGTLTRLSATLDPISRDTSPNSYSTIACSFSTTRACAWTVARYSVAVQNAS